MPPAATSDLIALRVDTNRRLRRASIAHAAVPLLAPQPWARRWQSSHRRPFAREIRSCRAILARIDRTIGPAPEFFKPRPAVAADRRIARLYAPAAAATESLFAPAPRKRRQPKPVAPIVTPAVTQIDANTVRQKIAEAIKRLLAASAQRPLAN